MKAKVKVANSQLNVQIKLNPHAAINEQELNLFARRVFRGFLKPTLVKSGILEYTGPVGLTLADRLKKPVNRYDFYFIMEQVLDTTQKLRRQGCPWNKVVWDLQYAYINEATKELQLIYLPLAEAEPIGGVVDFIERICSAAKPEPGSDMEFINRFGYYMHSLDGFDPAALEAFIAREEPEVVNTLRNHRAEGSGFMTDKRQDYYKHYADKAEAAQPTAQPVYQPAAQPVYQPAAQPTAQPVYQPVYQPAAQPVPQPAAQPIPQPAAQPAPQPAAQPAPQPVYQPAPQPAPQPVYQPAPQPVSAPAYREPAADLMQGEGSEETTLLSDPDSEATTLLVDNQVHYACLVRTLNGETVSLNKPVFRVGKERGCVDYCVTDNNAVSRRHVDIVTRGGRYFVIDLNSKNRTFINDQMIPIQFETELREGDRLRLGNEEFVFHI